MVSFIKVVMVIFPAITTLGKIGVFIASLIALAGATATIQGPLSTTVPACQSS